MYGKLDPLKDQRAITFGQLSHESVAKVEAHNLASLLHLQPQEASSG